MSILTAADIEAIREREQGCYLFAKVGVFEDVRALLRHIDALSSRSSLSPSAPRVDERAALEWAAWVAEDCARDVSTWPNAPTVSDSARRAATLRSLASRLAAPAVDGWRDIASAPKGGGADYVTDPAWVEPPMILLRFPNAPRGEKFCVAHWDWYYAEGGDGYDPRYGIHGGWIEPVSGERVILHYDPPTEWMPLAQPSGAKGE